MNSQFFLGVTLGSIEGVEEPEDAKRNAEVLSKTYHCDHKLPSQEMVCGTISELGNITVDLLSSLRLVSINCHCCT